MRVALEPSKSDGGPITQSQAAAYVTDFKAANPDGDKTLEKAEFSKACAQRAGEERRFERLPAQVRTGTAAAELSSKGYK